jgi:hypothetical protein
MKWNLAVLGKAQQKVLKQLGSLMAQHKFYLGGGTAIALHLGHRHSIDFDWFTAERMNEPLQVADEITQAGIRLMTNQTARGTLHGTVFEVRVSLLEYRYPLLKPAKKWPEFGCLIASLDDLACMKLSAVAQRGWRKDFLDIYALGLKHKSLKEMLRLYQRKYNVKDVAPVLYGLTYFDDAEKERMPKMLWKMDWKSVKQTIQEWVKELMG